MTTAPTYAQLLAFVEDIARLTTPEQEFAHDHELRETHECVEDYISDLSDERLCGEYEAFMATIRGAQALVGEVF